MSRTAAAWLVALALAGCSDTKKEEVRTTATETADKAKQAASTVKDKAASALDRAREVATRGVDLAKDKIGEAIELGAEVTESFAQRAGILDDLDGRIARATERVKTATTEAARATAQTALANLVKARAAIATKIDELKAAGTYRPR